MVNLFLICSNSVTTKPTEESDPARTKGKRSAQVFHKRDVFAAEQNEREIEDE